MNIFIDESGSFAIEGKPNKNNINCVAAIIMDDMALEKWNSKYSDLEKASSISDTSKVVEIIDFLADINAKAFLVLTDVSGYNDKILIHRNDYIVSLKPIINNNQHLLHSLSDLPQKISTFKGARYIKTYCSIQLAKNIIRGILVSQLSPENFKKLIWKYDFINDNEQKYVFQKLVLLELSIHSQEKPFILNDKNKIMNFTSHDGKYINLNEIFRDFTFTNENESPGIKAADCVANFLRRSLTGEDLFKNIKSLEKIFDITDSVEAIHFDKDKLYVDTDFPKDNLILSFINSKLDLLEN